MASEKISQICQDPLKIRHFQSECQKLLKKVETPEGWEETYQLLERNPTYTYRLGHFNEFIDEKTREGYTVNDQNEREFFCTLREFLFKKESQCSDQELQLPNTRSLGIDLFEKNWKIEGVVVRKSTSRACLLVKAPRSRGQNEMVLPYNAGEFPGLGLSLKVGDILRVTESKREEGKLSNPEIVRYAKDTDISEKCDADVFQIFAAESQ